MTAVSLNDLGKVYKARKWWQFWDIGSQYVEAVSHVHLKIEEGETPALCGANGSGKTTLLKIIGGLLYHDSGEARVLGHLLPRGIKEVRKQVFYLAPDERSFYHRLTVADNIRIFSVLMEHPVSDEILELFELNPLMKRRFGGLSSGQKQRVALARALSAKGNLYLLDEPTRSIDDAGVRNLKKWLNGTHRGDATVIMAFPREDPLMEYASRVLRIDGGRLV